MRLPRGSSLVFQMHYTTIGKPTTDRTRMGFIFAKEPPKMALSSRASPSTCAPRRNGSQPRAPGHTGPAHPFEGFHRVMLREAAG